MGLPRVSWWLNRRDPLYAFRWLLAAALIGGVVGCIALTPLLMRVSHGPCALS